MKSCNQTALYHAVLETPCFLWQRASLDTNYAEARLMMKLVQQLYYLDQQMHNIYIYIYKQYFIYRKYDIQNINIYVLCICWSG